jgi:hypothetical protein
MYPPASSSPAALRYLLGLFPSSKTLSTGYSSEGNLGQSEIDKITNNWKDYQDPVFICIDTEGLREIGISILDTRHFNDIGSAAEIPSIKSSLISSFNYHIKRNARAEWERPFQFGTSQTINANLVHPLLQKIFRTGHPDPDRKEIRNTVLVGHAFLDADIATIQKLTWAPWTFENYPYVLHFDTQSVRQAIFGGSPRYKLETLLNKMKVPYKHLHNGGNDAHFTLKVLLSLAVRDCPKSRYYPPEIQARKKFIHAIVKMPLPPTIRDHVEPTPFDPAGL